MFDRTTWIAIIVSIAGLVGWQYYYNKTYGPYLAQQAALKHHQDQQKQVAASPSPASLGTPTSVTPKTNSSSVPTLSARKATKDTGRAEYLFTSDIGGIDEVTLFLHLGAHEQSLFLNRDSGIPIGALCDANGAPLTGFAPDDLKPYGITGFTRNSPDGLVISKVFSLPQTFGSPEEYTVGLDITFRNSGTSPLSLPGYFVAIGGQAPVHTRDLPTYTCFDWYRDGKMTSIDVNWFEAGKIPLVGIQTRPARDLYSEGSGGISWAAVASQYFTTIVTPAQDQPGSAVWSRRYLAKEAMDSPTGQAIYGITGGIGTGSLTLSPGESVTRRYAIYAGPKDFYALQRIGGEQQKIMNFGMFHLVSEFLLWAMNSLQKIVHSYAAAIIILTILIKTALWPLQNKATASMKRMQLLSPKMTELREKHKDNPQKMNEELMKLYKQYGVNPFGGCLPMLIQIPIFFGFYSMLGSAIELRNSHFLWIHDLSQPDTIAHFLGFPINLLPILMGGTMLWQMAVSPKSGDPSQQRIMYFMPVIFLTFCYNYASGLALYWTTQNLFSIVQLYWTRNQPLPTLEKVKTPPKTKSGGGSGRKR
jgi:YidC/Oxa1 family membrane protein insertase